MSVVNMSRSAVREAAAEVDAGGTDNYLSRMAKYVPGDVIATYLVMLTIIAPSAGDQSKVSDRVKWVVYGLAAS